ncbi:MAG: hypothetical protein IPF69_12875 [Chitinophagaceae bacterium]|nr:hypothetical protein [Chitinophagaceae bacterium]
MNKKILGLDLGTNSIGWALIEPESQKILGMGSRIIPMGAELSKFEQGQAQTKKCKQTNYKRCKKAEQTLQTTQK